MAKPHMPAKSAVASSFSDDIVFLRMPGRSSERFQASGPWSLVQMTSGPFPPAELLFSFFWRAGRTKAPADVTGPELCGPWAWLVGSVNLRRAGRLPPPRAGRGSTRQLGSGGPGLRNLKTSATAS